MASAAFFNDLRRFSLALEKDCLELRTSMDSVCVSLSYR